MKHLNKIGAITSKISDYSVCLAVCSTFIILALILGEILARTFLGKSLLLTYQTCSWLLLALSFLGAGWTLKDGGHVQINIIVSRLSQRYQSWLLIILSSAAIVIISLFIVYVFQGFWEKYTTGVVGETIFRFPQWWAWVPFLVGTIVLLLQFVGMLCENVVKLKTLPKEKAEKKNFFFWVPIVSGILLLLMFVFFGVYGEELELGSGGLLVVSLLVLFCLILSGVWIFIALGATGVIMLSLFSPYPAGDIAIQATYFASSNFLLVCLPLFIFMGELLFSSGASTDLYSGIAPWVEPIPGRLLHSNILSCTAFAAVSGVSSVTTATIGAVAIPELKKKGYDEGVTIGSLAGAGTLGLLIPPSIALIIYGAITTESIGQLFMAGILPGLMLAAMFMAYIAIKAIRNPLLAPHSEPASWGEKISGLLKVIPIVFIIGMVLGLIYAGITTPTEASAIGALGAMLVTLAYRNLSWKNVRNASLRTIRTTGMIVLIIASASVLSASIAYLRIPQQIAAYLASSGLSKYVILTILCIIYLILGCLFDGASMMVLTLPIVYPLIIKLGFNGVWFGVILTVLIEAAQITPPVGFNLYVLQNISGRNIDMVIKNTIPFFFILCLGILFLIFFPDIALFLPEMNKTAP